MRRSDREITDLGEILSIINDCKVIHLAMVDDGEPYLLPLNFGYACEGGAFSFFCHSAREGRKLDILRKNPTVAFEMDCRGALDEHDVACQCGYYFASVTGVGHAYPQEIGKIALRACIFDGNLLEITVRDWG